MDWISIDTPLGRMGLVAGGNAITGLILPGGLLPFADQRETPVLAEGRRQLLAYFAGALRDFDLPLAPEGTEFQRAVWAALVAIPCGQTRSYADIAAALGRPKAVRAVGGANHNNPIAILIPCHRVVGKNGNLTGYAGGLTMKQKLLELEGALPC